MNKSEYHNPGTAISIQLASEFETNRVNESTFLITGSISGIVGYQVIIHQNPGLIILQPDGFVYGETVRVEQQLPIITINGPLNDIALEFTIRSTAAPTVIEETTEDLSPLRGSGMPAFTLDVNTAPTDLPIFFKNSGAVGDKYWGIIENDGTPIHTEEDANRGFDFKLNHSGYLTLFNDTPPAWLVMDSSYQVIDTVVTGNGFVTDNHEILHMPNGHSYVMAYDWQTVDMSVIVAGGNPAASVKGTIIQEVDENDNVIFQWRTWDYFQITDGNVDMTAASINYSHGNSIEVDGWGNLLLSFKNMDEVTYIDGTTGAFIWRFGGQNNMFTIINDPTGFVGQHDARWISGNRITLYDNGALHPVPLAAAKEFEMDTVAMTAELVWRFDHPLGVAADRTGNVQRLANGNTFINWGKRDNVSWPNWTEVDLAGTIVYQFRFTGGASYNTYRAHRYEWDLTVTDTPEQPEITPTTYPNPITDRWHVLLPATTGWLQIFDLDGRLLQNITLTPGSNTIDLEDYNSGIYLMRMEVAGQVHHKKVVKL